MRWLFTRTRVGRRVALRSSPATLDEAVAATRRINAGGMSVSLDHLGEHVTDTAAAGAPRDSYLACLDRIASEGLDANISVKLHVSEWVSTTSCAPVRSMRWRPGPLSAGLTMTIDMEESATPRRRSTSIATPNERMETLAWRSRPISAVLPKTSPPLLPLGVTSVCARERMTRQKRSPSAAATVNAAYDRLLDLLMATPSVKPAVATHDEERIAAAEDFSLVRTAPWEFQMLYGVRPTLQQKLVADGHTVRGVCPVWRLVVPLSHPTDRRATPQRLVLLPGSGRQVMVKRSAPVGASRNWQLARRALADSTGLELRS